MWRCRYVDCRFLTALVRVRTVHTMSARSSNCQLVIASGALCLLVACLAPGVRTAFPKDAGAPADASVPSMDGGVSTTVTVTTVAGNGGYVDGTGGSHGTAQFGWLNGIAVDSQGNVYVSDSGVNRIRKIDPSGNVSTFTGNGTAGLVDGTGGPSGTAEFNGPAGLAVDAKGDVYVADFWNNRIRRIDASGNVTTLPGESIWNSGTANTNCVLDQSIHAGIAIDSQGNVYAADCGNHRIRKIDTLGQVTTLAGNGLIGGTDGTGGPNGTAKFQGPTGVAVDTQGNVFVVEMAGSRIRKIDVSQNVTTVAGNGTWVSANGPGGPNGPAGFDNPTGIAIDTQGYLYVTDCYDNSIRKIDPAENVSTIAGNGEKGWTDGTVVARKAEFNAPDGVAVDVQGNVYITDNKRVRKLDIAGNVTTLAGNGEGNDGDGIGGPNGMAEFLGPIGVAADAQRNLYVAECWNNRIRQVDASGNVTTLAGNGTSGRADGTGGRNGTAEFDNPRGIAVDVQGVVYVADGHNNVRKIDTSGQVTTLAGNGRWGWVDGTGGPNGTAEFAEIEGIAVDNQGNVYVADGYNNRVRKVDASGNVTTLAGNGTQGWRDGTGGAQGTAEFYWPAGLAVDGHGDVYVADSGNNRIRKIDRSGNVTTFAGNGMEGWIDGTGGPDGTAEFWSPGGIAVDIEGNVYVSDCGDGRIRMVDPSGRVTTLAGNGVQGWADGLGGANGMAEFNFPGEVAVDNQGNVYVADTYNNRIRRIDR
jgi:sugar lactone lactonase YvrE